MDDYEVNLRRSLCTIPALMLCLLLLVLGALLYPHDEDALYYHAESPYGFLFGELAALTVLGGLVLAEWKYKSIYLLVETLRTFGGVLIFLTRADQGTAGIGAAVLICCMMPLLIYLISMKIHRKKIQKQEIPPKAPE